ncbi:XkdF-like putative serine protease domain-containing protein [Sphingobacterium chungjuense]|uniref:XkdF-like putative serine protease domain-containing protein n=1 Tax=Sphingobacterium chungjuense TaxID=2675553 RepID=UPI00140BD6EF|nr:XkdF-like putative serine protease domain-containing protein [Sphingobacterium chungjuense]
MNKDLPVYSIHISEDDDMIVDMVSIVAHPAIERNFQAFNSKQKTQIKYKFSDEEKHQLLGLALIPDQPIYRQDEDGTEYYVVFTAQEIETIVKAFMKRGLNNNLNVEHSAKDAHSFIFQSFITSDILPAPSILGEDIPSGSWIIGVQVQDEDLWTDIKDGKRNGFSVEGLFNLVQIDKEEKYTIDITPDEEEDDEDIDALLRQISAYSKYLTK